MLDLIISYVNFLILSIGYIVKRFTFFPPDPPHYKSFPTENEDEEDIFFLINHKKKTAKYIGIEFRLLEYRFIKIIDKDNHTLPLLLFRPPSHIPVCIIYSHGNSGDLGSCLLEYYDIALHTNCIVVSFEYPGYGECKNQPVTESQFFKNLKMTYLFVRKNLKFKSSNIILYGFSLGTGIIFDFACKKESSAAGIILQSPFLSIIRTLYNIRETQYFDLFNNCDKARHLHIKTFFIHGNNDHMVPYIHGRILAKLIPKQYFYDFLTIDKADHNNIFKIDKDLIYKRIREFIKHCTGKSSDFSKIKHIQEKHYSDDFDNNLKREKENKLTNSNGSESNKLNKSDELKRPTINLIQNNYPNININQSINNELGMLINYNKINNNYLKNSYPFYYNNYYNNQNNNTPYLQNNSQIFGRYKDGINNVPIIGKINEKSLKNYNIFNSNNVQETGLSTKILNETYLTNSTLNNLNNSK